MKRDRLLLSAVLMVGLAGPISAQRYLTEVFTGTDVQTNIVYGENYSVLTGTPVLQQLTMDVYTPSGDTASTRPLIIYCHTGSFLPRYINQLPTGDRNDSASVEMCKQFARKGYVVANVDYRLGWNPAAVDEVTRKQTIIQAVYRAMQDVKTAVRYFRKDVATNGNSFGIDENRIVLGGQGSGGYVVLAYATLQDVAEIQLLKFFNPNTNAFMVDPAIMGDFDGLGGNSALNNDNHPGYSNDIAMIFNIGGAMGDSSWLEQGEVPICNIHAVNDPFAPYGTGTVFVPGTPFAVVEVSGSSWVTERANTFGNNDVWLNPPFTDPITMYAMDKLAGTNNDGNEGLFPITALQNSAGAWEWWDSLTVVTGAAALGQNGQTILANGFASNPVYQALGPVAGRMRALAYVDTLQQYITPRMYRALELNVGINENPSISLGVSLFPNPATDVVTVNSAVAPVMFYEVFDINSRLVRTLNVNRDRFTVETAGMDAGVYFITLHFSEGTVTRKLILE